MPGGGGGSGFQLDDKRVVSPKSERSLHTGS